MLALWKKWTSIGLNPKQSRVQKTQIRLLNQIVSILLIGLIIRAFMDLLHQDWEGLTVLLTMASLFLMSFVFQYNEKHFLAKTYFTIVFLLSCSSVTMLMGRGLGGEFSFFTSFVLVMVFYYKAVNRVLLFSLILLFYGVSQWFITEYSPPLADSLTPISFHFMALANCICTVLITITFVNENRVFNKQTLDLLEDLKEKNKIQEINKEQIEQQNIKLEKVNKELERFAYVASHDLKTPLRSISSFLQLLNRKVVKIGINDEEVFEYIGFAIKSAKHMHFLIEDILEYSRLNRSDLKYRLVDLKEVVKEITFSFKQLLEERNAKIFQEELPVIHGNLSGLTLLLQNLIENGIKYNKKESPEIKISYKESENEHLIEVSDNGIGIDESYFHKIFEMFSRLHNQEEFQGSGIGLAICQKIVEQHGGVINLSSIPNQGSTFSITLPKDYLPTQLESGLKEKELEKSTF